MSDCDCHLEAHNEEQRQVLLSVFAINSVMFVAELAVGIFAQSSGVIADSLDMLADALVYGVVLAAIGKSASIKQRAARWSGVFQVALAAGIFVDVTRRAVYGSEPQSILMMGIASVALGANAYCLSLLQKHRHGDVHMRASWIFSRSDVIANAGVIVAGLLVWATGSRWPDLIVGSAIATVVVKGGLEILREVRRADPP
jgi:cation diffusion facilitator family transporter